ncbi:transposase [Streptomyces decoyicus]|uniref:transposase n=1 Tax=Streptomyces decoyicus TaxID=249567 RepID=UPI00399AADD9
MGDNPERLHSEASFAALCGVSPVERSSGSRQYRRLNRGGDRQANAALHRIVQTRLRFDPRTQDYYERRTKEGKPDARLSDASSTMPSARCSTWSGPHSHDPRHRGRGEEPPSAGSVRARPGVRACGPATPSSASSAWPGSRSA